MVPLQLLQAMKEHIGHVHVELVALNVNAVETGQLMQDTDESRSATNPVSNFV